jgi:hypothetical protein
MSGMLLYAVLASTKTGLSLISVFFVIAMVTLPLSFMMKL